MKFILVEKGGRRRRRRRRFRFSDSFLAHGLGKAIELEIRKDIVPGGVFLLLLLLLLLHELLLVCLLFLSKKHAKGRRSGDATMER